MKRHLPALIALAALTVVLGAVGGHPYAHPDVLLPRVTAVLAHGGDPGFFNYPGLVIYLDALVRLVAEQVGAGFAHADAITAGRVMTLVFAAGGVLATYGLAWVALRARAAAFLAGLAVAVSFGWVANAHFITVDIPLAALGAATVLAAVAVARRAGTPTVVASLGLGVLAGLTASAKYNGALVLAAALPAVVRAADRRGSALRAALVLLGAALAFLATNPYIALDPSAFARDFAFELNHAATGHSGFTTAAGWWFHIAHSLGSSFGPAPLVLAPVGAVVVARDRELPLPARLALLVYPALLCVVLALSRLAFERYALPLFPFVAVLFAAALAAAWRWAARAVWLRVAVVAVALAPPALALRVSILHDTILGRVDTRTWATALVDAAGLLGDRRVAAGLYLRGPLSGAGGHDSALGARVIVFDSFSHERYLSGDLLPNAEPVARRELLAGGAVIAISPYTVARARVPDSPQSLYSPAPPDLEVRRNPGPYIEIYVRDPGVAGRFKAACRSALFPCAVDRAEDGFYYQHLK